MKARNEGTGEGKEETAEGERMDGTGERVREGSGVGHEKKKHIIIIIIITGVEKRRK